MNYLPKRKDIKKIDKEWTTFYDSPLKKDFELLSFQEQLQVVADIIRQTIRYESDFNPDLETDLLKGDSYTAAKVAVRYLNELKLGTNPRIALASMRSYENVDKDCFHEIVLVDHDNETYYFNCAPLIGYGFGKVAILKDQPYFTRITELDSYLEKIIDKIRLYTYKVNTKIITRSELKEYRNIIAETKESKIINKYLQPNQNTSSYDATKLYYQINEWQEELQDLISSQKNLKRQLTLAQNITGTMQEVDPSVRKYTNIFGKTIDISTLSPRYFDDMELTLVLIKPSSYIINEEQSIKEKIIGNYNTTGNYMTSLGDKSSYLGLERMLFFHPHGNKYKRSMTGPSEVFLLNNSPAIIQNIKKEIRSTYAKELHNKEVTWFDNKYILWDPIITNLLHSADDAVETSLHYLANNPEYSLMTRFMYPNPALRKVLKDEHRI